MLCFPVSENGHNDREPSGPPCRVLFLKRLGPLKSIANPLGVYHADLRVSKHMDSIFLEWHCFQGVNGAGEKTVSLRRSDPPHIIERAGGRVRTRTQVF